MKKIFLSLLAVCMVGSMAFAQTYKGEHYLVNKFKDNWFISVGAGVQTWNRINKGDSKYNFKNKVNGEVEIGFGKYFTPVFGVRAQFQGGYYVKGYNTEIGTNMTGDVSSDKGYEFAFKYGFVHVDGLVNISNWIGGYKDRVYNATAAIGFGYARSQSRGNDNRNNEFAASLGLINSFRLCKGLDFNIELKSMFVRQEFAGDGSEAGRYGAIPSITGGFTYKFKERGWETTAAAIAAALASVDYTPYTDRISDLEDELSASQARADKLAKELAKAPKQTKVITSNIAGPVAVFFTIGKANISKKDKINLEYVAKAIRENPDKKYTVYGYADKETGTEAFNQKLSQKRADNVVKELVKLGVKESQLTAKGMGCNNNLFEGPLNRVVIVE